MVDYKDAIGFILDYICDNRSILRCAYQSLGRDMLTQFFYSDFVDNTELVVSGYEIENNLYLPKNLKKYYCNFLTGAVAEILLHYVIDDQSWSRLESIENISVILQTSVLGLLAKKGTAR